VQRKHICSTRWATEIIAVRSSSPQASSFWTVVGHISPGDTNLGTAWWLPARRQLSWNSPNGLGFAPVCWELRYRDLWKWHREPAKVVTLAGWMCEQGAAAVVMAEWGPHGNLDNCYQLAKTRWEWLDGWDAFFVSEPLMTRPPGFPFHRFHLVLMPLANIDGAVRTNPCKSAIRR